MIITQLLFGLLLAAAIHGILTSIKTVATAADRHSRNWLLSTTVLSFACSIFAYLFNQLPQAKLYAQPGLVIPFSFCMVMPPLLYFYIRENITEKKPTAREIGIHLIPFWLFVLQIIVFYTAELMFIPKLWVPHIGVVYTLAYSIFSLIKFQHLLKRPAPSTETDNLRQTIRIINTLLAYSIIFAVFVELTIARIPGMVPISFSLKLICAGCIYFISYVNQPRHVIYMNIHSRSGNGERYKNSKIPEGEVEIILQRLDKLITQEQIYLNPELRMKDVADRIKISSHYLSQVVNEKYQQTFPEFINHHRIEEAKRIFASLTEAPVITHVAYQCGFNNKVSFNTSFKKHTGLTPSMYYKEHLNSKPKFLKAI